MLNIIYSFFRGYLFLFYTYEFLSKCMFVQHLYAVPMVATRVLDPVRVEL